jgi:hypothetical protein
MPSLARLDLPTPALPTVGPLPELPSSRLPDLEMPLSAPRPPDLAAPVLPQMPPLPEVPEVPEVPDMPPVPMTEITFPTPPAAVEPAAAPVAAAPVGEPAAPGLPGLPGLAGLSAAAAPADLDELARKLYDRIRWRMRNELRLDSERAGLGAGIHR